MEKTHAQEYLQMIYPRVGFLDAISVTGGEPTLHRDITDFIHELRYMGYHVKLDTNATKPRMLKRILERDLVDYYSVYLPAPLERFNEVTQTRNSIDTMRQTIQMMRRASVPVEWVTMPVPGYVEQEDVERIAQTVIGSKRFVLRRWTPTPGDPECGDVKPYSEKELRQMRDVVAPFFSEVVIKG